MLQKVKGTKDYYGIEAFKVIQAIKYLRQIAKHYYFQEIIFPTLEFESLFSHLLGSKSEVVGNELFTLIDRKDRKLALRPEGTSSSLRLAIEGKLLTNVIRTKLFYVGSMFRYERPQQGRQREFFQFGVEVINDNSLIQIVELLQLAIQCLEKFKIKYILKLNWIGNFEQRKQFLKELENFYCKNFKKLSEYSKIRFKQKKFFRILDSKEKTDVLLNKTAPKLLKFLPKEDQEKFQLILSSLDEINIIYEHDFSLVRGLEYYDNFVFEFKAKDQTKIGSKNTIIAGGNYNNLINKLNSKINYPAIGFAIGLERLIMASDETEFFSKYLELDYYLICNNKVKQLQALNLIKTLRNSYIVETDFTERKIKKQLQKAISLKAKQVIIYDDNLPDKHIIVRDLVKNKQVIISIDKFLKSLFKS